MDKSRASLFAGTLVAIAAIISFVAPQILFGATILTTNASDSLTVFRQNSNANFAELNSQKLELSDLDGIDFFSTTSADHWKTQRDFFSTTSVSYWKSVTDLFSTTSNDYWKTQHDFFSTTSADYLLSTYTKGFFFSTTSADHWKSVSSFFSTTSASYFLSQNQGAAFSTTSADAWRDTRNFFSTTSADYHFSTKSIEDLSDVAAMTENYGDILYWNGSTWADIATSSLGISGGGSSFAYLFPGNATTTGLGIYASTTIGAGTPTTGLTIFGNATTTGNTLVNGNATTSGALHVGTMLSIEQPGYGLSYNFGTLQFRINGSTEITLSSTSFSPSNDGNALGSGTNAWSDLFLASGGVINWANGDVTLTHSTGNLALSSGLTAASTTISGTTTTSRLNVTGGINLLGEYFTNFTTYVRSLFSAGTGLSYSAGQFAINLAANLAWTGAHDFGGATSLEAPNGSSPTVDAIGEFGVDTSENEWIYATSTNSAAPAVLKPFVTISGGHATSTWVGTTTQLLGPAPYPGYIKLGRCDMISGTVGVSIYDGTNRANYMTASSTVGTFSYSTNNSFTTGEPIRVDFGTPGSSPTQIACRWEYWPTRN